MIVKRTVIVVAALAVFAGGQPRAETAKAIPHVPTMTQFMSAGYPVELVAATKADRVAWIANDKGLRNVFTAAAPDFKPVRVTSFLKDDGVDTTQLEISDDGTVVSFTRGATLNTEGWVASPEADPNGVERAIWAARTTGGAAWRLSEGQNGALSPDGRYVAFAKDGEIFRVPTAQAGPRVTDVDKGTKPFIRIWGTNAGPTWSPDGRKIAFVSSRTNHSFVAVYDVASHKVTYMSPSVDWDASPTWSPDSTRIAFIRRPGTPFAQQAQPGSGGLGNPAGPAFNPATAQGRGGGGRGGRGGGNVEGRGGAPGQGRGDTQGRAGQPQGRGAEANAQNAPTPRAGLTDSSFPGGYNLSFWVADVKTGDAQEFWHNAKDEKVFNGINAISWHGDRVVFQLEPEEWTRFYSLSVVSSGPIHNTGPNDRTDVLNVGDVAQAPAPLSLTPQEGQIETSSFSADGKYLYYGTNASDIERRHLWRVPVSGGAPEQLTRGEGIEHDPFLLPSGRIAALTSDYKRPQSVAIFPATKQALDASAQKVVYPILARDFPTDAHVVPQLVLTKAEDGLEIHNQLFLPKDLKPGEKRPAIIFVHGGPVRQMLPGYHYM